MDKCPFCRLDGKEVTLLTQGKAFEYGCGTRDIPGQPRSRKCYETERNRLLAENHEVKAELYRVKARLRDALHLLDKTRIRIEDTDRPLREIKDFLDKDSTEQTP